CKTDVPCHLTIRYTDTEQVAHPRTWSKRGLRVLVNPKYCLVKYQEDEQAQNGDTFWHTFGWTGWPPGGAFWWFVYGTSAGVPCLSNTATIHAVYEEQKGADQVGVSDLIKAMEMIPWQSMQWDAFDTSITGWDFSGCTGSGEATFGGGMLTLSTGGVPGSHACAQLYYYPNRHFEYGLKDQIRFIALVPTTAPDVYLAMARGTLWAGHGYGAEFLGREIRALIGEPGWWETRSFDYPFVANRPYLIECKYNPEPWRRSELWVDGIYLGRIDTVPPWANDHRITFDLYTYESININAQIRWCNVWKQSIFTGGYHQE
ncbi:unnamed protein product, partial [marine sediment metagenome]